MIFEAKEHADLDKVAISKIVEHVSLREFLIETPKNKNIMTCPTNALELETNSINLKCNDCGLCWILNKNIINKKEVKPDILKFKKCIFKDKMFIYRWLSLSVDNYAGTEIKSKGFSRDKRIPLIIKKGDSLYFVKAIRDIADIEKAEIEMQDILDLSNNLLKDFNTKVIIIILDKSQFEPKTKESILIYLEELYKKIISKGKQDIEVLL